MKRRNHMGKLGTVMPDATAVMADLAVDGSAANGPEDLPDWDAIDWRHQEEQVRRLQQRIFKAGQAGDRRQVRNLQKLLLRSRANTLVSVRRVTQHNAGRPGRGCHDAVEMIHKAVAARGAKRDWVLDADLKSAFDKIDHNFLIARLGTFPAREQVRAWLKAGVVDKGRYSPTEGGTPQGGVISPLLLNIALQGMDEAAGVRYDSRGHVKAGCPAVIVCADDFVALCHSREQAEAVQAKLSVWLKHRGLSLNKEKTRIGRVSDGFDFLSFGIRRYRTSQGSKVLTRPSRDAMRKMRRRLADELRAMRGSPVAGGDLRS